EDATSALVEDLGTADQIIPVPPETHDAMADVLELDLMANPMAQGSQRNSVIHLLADKLLHRPLKNRLGIEALVLVGCVRPCEDTFDIPGLASALGLFLEKLEVLGIDAKISQEFLLGAGSQCYFPFSWPTFSRRGHWLPPSFRASSRMK